MSAEFDREERAFAAAFRDAIADQAFLPLDPATVKASAPPRRSLGGPWAKGLAAAAAVVVMAGAAGLVLPRVLGGVAAGSGSMAGAPAPAGGAAPADASKAENGSVTPADEVGPVTMGAPPPAAPGRRWESFRDVMVQVPQAWGYARSAGSAHCITDDLPTAPHVDLNRGGEPVAAILCPDLADELQVLHLSFTPAEYPEPTTPPGSAWRPYTLVLGGARVTVVAREADAELAREILSSAIQVDVDQNGCPARRDPVPAVDLAGLDASVLVVCQYDATDAGELLRASVPLDGDRARRAWQAVLAAPGGGGPDGSEQDCRDLPGSPLLLLVGADRVPVAASVVACRGNGVVDAGATGGLREITRDVCRGLLVDPVRVTGGPGEAGRRCLGQTPLR